MNDIVKEKMQLLKDFGILSGCTRKEKMIVHKAIASCENELQMEQKIYNLIHGTEKINDFIARHMTQLRQLKTITR